MHVLVEKQNSLLPAVNTFWCLLMIFGNSMSGSVRPDLDPSCLTL